MHCISFILIKTFSRTAGKKIIIKPHFEICEASLSAICFRCIVVGGNAVNVTNTTVL